MYLKYLIFAILFTQPLCLQTIDQHWQDLKQLNFEGSELVYPSYEANFEIYNTQTFYDDHIYVGTSPRGHIFKINFNSPDTVHDIGRVFPEQQTIDVRALTNDGQYLYGGSSLLTGLFFYKLDDTSDIISFGEEFFQKNGILMVLSPQIYESTDHKYIFFCCSSRSDKIQIIKWKINKFGSSSVPDTDLNNVEVITIEEAGIIDENFSMSCGVTNFSGNPVLVIGTHKNQIIIYDIKNENSIVYPVTINSLQLITTTDYPDYCWIFDGSKCYEFDLNSGSISGDWDITSNQDINSQLLYYNDVVYSQYNYINLSNSKVKAITGSGQIRGRSIMTDGKDVFGLSFWGGETAKPYIDKAPIKTMAASWNRISDPSPRPYSSPYGGGPITGLTAFNNILYGSNALLTHFIYNPSISSRRYNSHPTGTAQADVMLAYNGYIYYGYYNGPYFQEMRIADGFRGKLYNIQELINDEDQLRIWSLAEYEDYIFIGTYAREYAQDSKAWILRYQISSQDLTPVGKVDASHISSLTIAPVPESINEVYIYGSTNDGVFVHKHSLSSSFGNISGNLIEVNRDNHFHRGVYAVLYTNSKLYILYNKWVRWRETYIGRYDELPENINDFGSTSNFVDNQLSRYPIAGAQMIKGNDGFIYAYRGYNDYGYIPIEIHNNLYRISPSTLSSSAIFGTNNIPVNNHSQIINRITSDRGNPNNKNIYVGFINGRLMKYDPNGDSE